TLMLYFRQILIMAVSLYTVRVVLNVLGAEDYGIYNVVAGVVTMFGFLSGAMATASQRYFSFDLGKGDTENLKKTFSVTLTIYALLALLIVLLAETLGLWFVYNKLVIPPERLTAAKWIYQAAVASFLFTLITTPYMSAIIAHESMDVYAYVSIVEVALKLGIVFLLQVLPFDKLIVYGFLLLAVAIINTSLYRLYCIKKYTECKFCFLWDKELFSDILSFTGWTLFGQFTSIVRNQAVTVLFNQFFTPVVVAARSISLQVTNAVNVFSQNFNTSLYPPIIKEYSSGNKDAMYNLLYNGCKMTLFLMWVFALPLILNMQAVLSLWLKNVPEWTVLFTQLALVEVLINSLGQPIATAARAPGKMKTYELSLGSLQLIIFILSWILFKAGYQAWISFAIAIGVNLVMMVLRLVLVHGLVGLPLRQFTIRTAIPLLFMMVVSFTFAFLMNHFMPKGVISSFVQIFITVPVTCLVMYFLGMNREQRTMIVGIVKRKIGKKI
nr:hypothetical protein [Treponema sp.]